MEIKEINIEPEDGGRKSNSLMEIREINIEPEDRGRNINSLIEIREINIEPENSTFHQPVMQASIGGESLRQRDCCKSLNFVQSSPECD